ncbi:MAG TPA: hypothetical protein VF065_00635 [Ilumatobacter sp.]
MLAITVGDEVHVLDEGTASGLVQRVRMSSSLLEGGEPEPGTTLFKLRHAQEPTDLDQADLALILVELEAWNLEVDGDLPADAQALRSAITALLH